MYTLNTEKDAIQKYETATRWPALVRSDGNAQVEAEEYQELMNPKERQYRT